MHDDQHLHNASSGIDSALSTLPVLFYLLPTSNHLPMAPTVLNGESDRFCQLGQLVWSLSASVSKLGKQAQALTRAKSLLHNGNTIKMHAHLIDSFQGAAAQLQDGIKKERLN